MRRPFEKTTFLAAFGVLFLLSGLAFFSSSVVVPKPVYACACAPGTCADSDCSRALGELTAIHARMRLHTQIEFDNDLATFESWLINVMLNTEFVPAMADMATQMSAVSMKYTEMIGMFIDAQNQIEAQRLLKEMQFQAHKDYRPSEGFCQFGTNVRSLAATENKGRFNSLVLARLGFSRQVGIPGNAGAEYAENDYKARWGQFTTTYCDRRDNNFSTPGLTGLELACDHDGRDTGTDVGAVNPDRVNRDIDYTRLIEEPRTLDVDFTNNTLDTSDPSIPLGGTIAQPRDEEDVIALSRNLYGNKVLSRNLSADSLSSSSGQKYLLALRSIAAKRGVAQASFNAIVGLKSGGTGGDQSGAITHAPSGGTHNAEDEQTQKYMAAIMRELLPTGASGAEGDIYSLIGHSPSYYAQLEILAKRIYQNPDFYADLYDTPANVARKKVAMKAIELMVDRAMYESQLRREMSISVLLSSELRADYRRARGGTAVSPGSNN